MVCLVKIEARQRCTPREKGCGHPLSEEEELSKETVKSFIEVASSGSLSSFRSTIWFLFPHLTYPGTLGCACIPQPRWTFKWRLLRGARLIMAWHFPLTFDPQGTFLHICSVFLVPKKGVQRSPKYSKRILPLFVLAMIIMWLWWH